MKYMGSKRAMLQNGLGELLDREVEINGMSRFVDLFAGSGAVAIHVAKKFPIHVMAFDLQKYSAVIAGAVIEREQQFDWERVWLKWEKRALARYSKIRLPRENTLTRAVVSDYREWSGDQDDLRITRAYGGYYYSPQQAASRCAAAPGHTAQPFQPTRSAKPFLREAWSKDIAQITKTIFISLASEFAQQRGEAKVLDANTAAKQLGEGDIAFIDPPYSGVHYSRFYHVLETIARCKDVEVSGRGRYPAPKFRPRSKYSVMTEAPAALSELFCTIASRGAKAIITFPHDKCSNGLSGYKVRSIAEKYFLVERASVSSRLSTLGGRGDNKNGESGRAARRHTRELMLVLKPK